jgi:hypothetical protein
VHGLLLLAASLAFEPNVGRAQELVFDALVAADDDRRRHLLPLAETLGLVV